MERPTVPVLRRLNATLLCRSFMLAADSPVCGVLSPSGYRWRKERCTGEEDYVCNNYFWQILCRLPSSLGRHLMTASLQLPLFDGAILSRRTMIAEVLCGAHDNLEPTTT